MLKELFTSNPILLDFRRSIRKFFGVGRQGKLNLAVSTISALIYGLVLLIAWTTREYVSPMAYVIVLNVLLCLIVPAAMHGAIAGERERRSWDFLMVAPISNAQIVAGKFMSGLGLIALMTSLFLPMMIISFNDKTDASLSKTVGMLAVTISFAVFLAAFSLYISSRSKRAFAANLSIYGFQFLGLVVYPIVVLILSQGASETWAFFLHPFMVNAALWQGAQSYSYSYRNDNILLTGGGIIQALTFTLMALALLGWTEATLRDIDRKDGGG